MHARLSRWRDSCQRWHPGWQHMFWDSERAEALLKERYEWFLPTWRSYPRVVHKGAASLPSACPLSKKVLSSALAAACSALASSILRAHLACPWTSDIALKQP